MTDPREPLGRLVREVWVRWAKEQPGAKASWLLGWEDLDDGQREVDMRIGEAIAVEARTAERERIRKLATEYGAAYFTGNAVDGIDRNDFADLIGDRP